MVLRILLGCAIICGGYAQIVIDSSSTTMSLWTQRGNVISFNPSVDAILIAHRAYQWGINVHSAPGDLSIWFHDENVCNYQSRWIINTLAGGNPYIAFTTWPEGLVAERCVGWFTGNWEPPVTWGPDSITMGPLIPYQLPDSNILFIYVAVAFRNIIATVMPPDLSSPLSYDTIARNVFFWGSDFNAGIGYVFYYDETLNVYYRVTTDGINWGPEQVYDLVLPNPYPNSVLYWTQAAINDSGKPLLVFDVINGDDYQYGQYPWYGKVYVSYQEGQPCIEVSSTFGTPDTECFYSTIATGGNMAAVLYCTPRNNEPDSATWWDFYVNWSTDYGRTWGIPKNITQSFNRRPALPQLAKRIDATRGWVYYVAATFKFLDWDPLWTLIYGNDYPIDVLFGYGTYPGIEERTKNEEGAPGYNLFIYSNPVHDRALIRLEISNLKSKILLKIYDATGRLIKQWDYTKIRLSDNICWDGTDNARHRLPGGVYFVQLSDNNGVIIKKVVKLE